MALPLWKDFTGIVKNVFGIRATSNLFFGAFNNNKNIGISHYQTNGSGTYTNTDAVESGTMRGELANNHSIETTGVINTADRLFGVQNGYGSLATRILSSEDRIGSGTAISEWSVPNRFDVRHTVPMVSGVITDLSSINIGLEVGKVYLYTGSTATICINTSTSSLLAGVSVDISTGDLFYALETVSSSADVRGDEGTVTGLPVTKTAGKIIPLSRNMTTSFMTAHSLAGTLGPHNGIIFNPGVASDAGLTLTTDSIYCNDRTFNQFGRTDIQWTRKTPEPYSPVTIIPSGVLSFSATNLTSVISNAFIPTGCCITGISVVIGAAIAGVPGWVMKLVKSNGDLITASVLSGTSINNTINTETQIDDMIFGTSGGFSEDTYLQMSTTASTGNVTIYVKYSPIYAG